MSKPNIMQSPACTSAAWLLCGLWVLRRRTNRRPCRPPMSNPSTSPWTAWPDGLGRWDNRMAAHHLPRDLVRPSSGKELAQTMKKKVFTVQPQCCAATSLQNTNTYAREYSTSHDVIQRTPMHTDDRPKKPSQFAELVSNVERRSGGRLIFVIFLKSKLNAECFFSGGSFLHCFMIF